MADAPCVTRFLTALIHPQLSTMIVIIDYQMGNLASVQRAFQRAGHEAVITSDPDRVAAADKVVLPGVGAFQDAMEELRRHGLVQPVRDAIAAGRPFLGICLGLQMLFDVSFEDGEHAGLGILPGKVVRFDLPSGYKIPHMGWNQLGIRRPTPVLEGIDDGSYFYFVHSYYVVPDDPAVVVVETDYARPFCSMIWHENLYATQFHPEKSQANGLR